MHVKLRIFQNDAAIICTQCKVLLCTIKLYDVALDFSIDLDIRRGCFCSLLYPHSSTDVWPS